MTSEQMSSADLTAKQKAAMKAKTQKILADNKKKEVK